MDERKNIFLCDSNTYKRVETKKGCLFVTWEFTAAVTRETGPETAGLGPAAPAFCKGRSDWPRARAV